jgi:hypothetical protein
MYGPNQEIYQTDPYEKYVLKQHPDYPWHWQQKPCPNWLNCIGENGSKMCFNCNPNYYQQQNCSVCHFPSKGGRFICCGKPICQKCYKCPNNGYTERYIGSLKVKEPKPSYHDCGKQIGYFNSRNEIPVMRFKL